MELDREMKILIVIVLYLLFSIITSWIIYSMLQNLDNIITSVIIGMIVGTVIIFYLIKLIRIIEKRKRG